MDTGLEPRVYGTFRVRVLLASCLERRPRVCGIYATRIPRLLFPRLPFLQREPRVCYSRVCDSRVCYSRNANSRVCEPPRLTFKTRVSLWRVPSSMDYGPFGISDDLGE